MRSQRLIAVSSSLRVVSAVRAADDVLRIPLAQHFKKNSDAVPQPWLALKPALTVVADTDASATVEAGTRVLQR